MSALWGEWSDKTECPGRRAYLYRQASETFLERLWAAHGKPEEPEPVDMFQFAPPAQSEPLWRPRATAILIEIANNTGLDPEDIIGHRRFKKMVIARQLFYWRLWREMKWNCGRIGRFVGNRDRTTALFGVRKIEAMHQAGTLQARLDELYGGQG